MMILNKLDEITFEEPITDFVEVLLWELDRKPTQKLNRLSHFLQFKRTALAVTMERLLSCKMRLLT